MTTPKKILLDVFFFKALNLLFGFHFTIVWKQPAKEKKEKKNQHDCSIEEMKLKAYNNLNSTLHKIMV
jgi:arabinogalactan endo-1,4-beta-galactosidase